jgi:hypothetical protein
MTPEWVGSARKKTLFEGRLRQARPQRGLNHRRGVETAALFVLLRSTTS